MLIKRALRFVVPVMMSTLLWGALTACSDKAHIAATGPVSGSSIIENGKGDRIYTANTDVNTVSVIDAKSLQVVSEIQVGKEPQQLALSRDGKRLFVTCKYTDTVEIIDLKKAKVVGSVAVGIEPYGIVSDPDGSFLYVSSDRSSTISVIDTKEGSVAATIKVADRPRALALTADGKKLYAAHYLSGKISVVDTAARTVGKTIQLSPSPDLADRKKSQGIPNGLEQIRIAPDGRTAWVSHLLTNVDTPIQFEETVFPAISVLDLTKDEEMAGSRKELFKAIDVKNTLNETIIVSNPADIAFSPDGLKAYVAMSGSEDLLVFDLNRGGKASHMIHRVPGDHPEGLSMSPDGKRLYVHNTISHDLAVVDTGGDDAYAEAKVEGKNIPLIAQDPLPALVREGKKIFYSANSDKYPITGKNWMSCASCHDGGEINGLTLMTAKGPRNVPSNVLAMKTGLFMWDGSRDDLADYILTVQDEMGGLEGEDPGKPMKKETQHLFDALQAFLEYPDTFPVPKSPYLNADGSLTELAKQGKELFEGKAGCIQCHAGDVFTDSTKAVDSSGHLTTDNTQFLYDVGTKNKDDVGYKGDGRANFTNTREANKFDVPTLRGVWATAPYLHDGSAATLHDVLVARNGENKHGNTSKLTEQEVDAIVEYLKSID